MTRLHLLLIAALAACAPLPLACSSTSSTGSAPAMDDAGAMDDTGTTDETTPPADAGTDLGPFTMASHPAYPQVPRLGSGTLSPMKLVTITASGDPNGGDFAGFTSALVASKWFPAVGRDYGLAAPTAGPALVGAAITASSLSSNAMESYIANTIAGHAAAQPSGHTMYILLLPPGTGEAMDPMCQVFGGYHLPYGSGGDAWGFVQRCPNPPGLSQTQWLSVAASHEIIEAATDVNRDGWSLGAANPPYTGTVWETLLGEVGDLCVSTQIAEGLYTYQRVWSNSAAAAGGDPCVPASPKPYFNAAPTAGAGGKGWFAVPAGGQVTVPVTGFSTARVVDWVVTPALTKSTCGGGACGGDFTVTIKSPTSTTIRGTTYQTINNGVTATMTLKAPAGAPSGSYGEILIASEPIIPPPGGDPFHLWPVGVYVQ